MAADSRRQELALSEIIPSGMLVGVGLLICEKGRYLFGARPVREEGRRRIVELTGIGGKMEAQDLTCTAAALREAREEMGCGARVGSARSTLIVRGLGEVERVSLEGSERPAAVVFRDFGVPPHRPWDASRRGEYCVVVFQAELLGQPYPAMELPWLAWLRPEEVVRTAREDVLLGDLAESGVEFVSGDGEPPPEGVWVRMTDSHEALALGLGEDALGFYTEPG